VAGVEDYVSVEKIITLLIEKVNYTILF